MLHAEICVDKYFITDYGVFYGINAGLFNRTGLRTGHSTVVDGITPHKSSLFKRGGNVVMEVILPHFRARPFCVVVLSSLWNQRSRCSSWRKPPQKKHPLLVDTLSSADI